MPIQSGAHEGNSDAVSGFYTGVTKYNSSTGIYDHAYSCCNISSPMCMEFCCIDKNDSIEMDINKCEHPLWLLYQYQGTQWRAKYTSDGDRRVIINKLEYHPEHSSVTVAYRGTGVGLRRNRSRVRFLVRCHMRVYHTTCSQHLRIFGSFRCVKCTHDVHVPYTWRTHYVHMTHAWRTHDVHMTYTWWDTKSCVKSQIVKSKNLARMFWWFKWFNWQWRRRRKSRYNEARRRLGEIH